MVAAVEHFVSGARHSQLSSQSCMVKPASGPQVVVQNEPLFVIAEQQTWPPGQFFALRQASRGFSIVFAQAPSKRQA